MLDFKKQKENYLEYCQFQKGLNLKTIKAYRIDLIQFSTYANEKNYDDWLSRSCIISYITDLHKKYKPKSAKRKVASLKAFFSYLLYEEIIDDDPFQKIHTKFREPVVLPKTIPFTSVQMLLTTVYKEANENKNRDSHNYGLRDIAVLELLFATGMRVSELCNLSGDDLNLEQGIVRIFGKGSKERIVQIANSEVLQALIRYKNQYITDIHSTGAFFINRRHSRLSEQSVRQIINKYVEKSALTLHITPHMFRHTFATLLLEEDVDIRYIQSLLGHSSITTTQIYTHVTSKKQKDILINQHPRNKIQV